MVLLAQVVINGSARHHACEIWSCLIEALAELSKAAPFTLHRLTKFNVKILMGDPSQPL